MSSWNNLSMAQRAEVIKLAVQNGIHDLDTIRGAYNEYAGGGSIHTNPGMTGMMKAKLATAAHYGNPTARRMANYDGRDYVWSGEYEYDKGIGEPRRGNVYVGSYDNLVTPRIQDTGNGLTYIDNVWSPENDQRSYMQSLKFNNEKDARYFGEHYKEIAPMMGLYSNGGSIHIKSENRGKFTALKERTGHSATWFKEHGTPAQRKMATFALNARHWKHADGGNLFSGEERGSQQMKRREGAARSYTIDGITYGAPYYNYDEPGRPLYRNATLPEIVITPPDWNFEREKEKALIRKRRNSKYRYIPETPGMKVYDATKKSKVRKAAEGLSNLWNYSKGYLKNKFNGDDSGILLNLADKNVSRIMSHTGDVETILTNDFIENNNNMVRKKKDFINTTDTLLGDKKIPLSKISTFYGIEDGKLKAGPLDIFNDETVVVPNRAKYIGRIKEYHAGIPATEAFREAVNKDIENYNNLHNYTPSLSQRINSILTFSKPEPSGTLSSNVGLDKAIDIKNYFEEKHKKLGAPESSYVITENNDTIRGYDLNASPKTLFADENGNAIFVSSPRKHAKELNSYLKEHPMYPIMVDNGRYASYQTDFPNAEVYGGLNRPNNMFIIGTTKKKALGGNIYDGTTEDSQQMNIGGGPFSYIQRMLSEAQNMSRFARKPSYEEALKQAGERVERQKDISTTVHNDNTWVAGRHGKKKNSELQESKAETLRRAGAEQKLWRQEHPYLAFAGDALTVAPIAVAATPFIAGTIEAAPEIWAASQTPVGQTLLAGTLGGEAWEALNHGITGQSWGDNLGDVIGLDKDNYWGRTTLGLTNPFYGLSPSMIYRGGEAVLGAGKTALDLAKNTTSKSVEALQMTPVSRENTLFSKIPQNEIEGYFKEIEPVDKVLQQAAKQNTSSAVPLKDFFENQSLGVTPEYRKAIVQGANKADDFLWSDGYIKRFDKAVENLMEEPGNEALFNTPEYTIYMGERKSPKAISRIERLKMDDNLWSTKVPENYYPAGYLENSRGNFEDALGLYNSDHRIGIDERTAEILNNNTPEHEFYHAMRGNFKNKDIIRTNNKKYQMDHPDSYYRGLEEQRVRVLSALREMQDAGININNLTDDVIDSFFAQPKEAFSSNTLDLITRYDMQDIKKALKGFLGYAAPIGITYETVTDTK